MLKVTAIADTHGNHENVFFDNKHIESDLLIYAGDYSSKPRELEDYVQSFLAWFSSQPQKYKILTSGNWDFFAQTSPHRMRAIMPSNIMYIENDSITIDGKKIFVSPIVVDMKGWAFSKTSEEAEVIWKRIPDDTDILITHTPPYGIRDTDRHGRHHGCKKLLDRIKELKSLNVHVFGHTHSSSGKINRNGKKFFNVSVYNKEFPTYFEI